MAIGASISHSHNDAVTQLYPAGPLDMEEKCIRRAVHPDQFQFSVFKCAAFDFAPVRIGDKPSLDHPAGNLLAFKVVAKMAQADGHEVGRPDVQRYIETRSALAGAA